MADPTRFHFELSDDRPPFAPLAETPHPDFRWLTRHRALMRPPRVGRNRLPLDAPSKAIIDCSDYFNYLSGDAMAKQHDQLVSIGTFDHSWHIGNRLFTQDLFETLKGDLDRKVLPTRITADGCVKLHWS